MTKPKIILTCGLPASGKTTFALERVESDGWVNANRDDIRLAQFGKYVVTSEQENHVSFVQDGIISSALRGNRTVVVSDTNLNSKSVKRFSQMATKLGVEMEIVYFDVDLEECIRRNAQRSDKPPVPEHVIRGMHKRYIGKRKSIAGMFDHFTVAPHTLFKPYVAPTGVGDAVIIDLDGTIALHNNRSPFDYNKLNTDILNENVASVIRKVLSDGSIEPIFVSGRPASHFDMTVDWIRKHLFSSDDIAITLFMRKTGDNRNDAIVKLEIFDEFIRDNFNVICCFDDRRRVIDAWRGIGLTVLDVAGNEF